MQVPIHHVGFRRVKKALLFIKTQEPAEIPKQRNKNDCHQFNLSQEIALL